MHVLVLANGAPPAPLLLERLCGESDLFLAADGAANRLAELDLPPHIILGDFDSLTDEARGRLVTAELVEAADQEASDLDKALEYLLRRGAKRVTITGASGGRLDHFLANVSLLLKYADALDIRIVEDQGSLVLLRDTVEIEGAEGDIVSIVVFESVHGVTTEGLAWPLADATLLPGSRGVSNWLAGASARITVREGRAFVCHLHLPQLLDTATDSA